MSSSPKKKEVRTGLFRKTSTTFDLRSESQLKQLRKALLSARSANDTWLNTIERQAQAILRHEARHLPEAEAQRRRTRAGIYRTERELFAMHTLGLVEQIRKAREDRDVETAVHCARALQEMCMREALRPAEPLVLQEQKRRASSGGKAKYTQKDIDKWKERDQELRTTTKLSQAGRAETIADEFKVNKHTVRRYLTRH